MEILFIRHGATAGNLEKRYVGRTDEPLCGEGLRQLKKNIAPGENGYPDWRGQEAYVVVSPMKRCRQTAAVFEAQMHILKQELILDPDLREMDFGDFEYCNYEELKEYPAYQRFLETNGGSSFPNAEPPAQFRECCVRGFLRSMEKLEQKGAQKAVFVVHGGTIMAVMERFSDEKRPYFAWQVKNGCGFLVNAERAGTLYRLKKCGAKIVS